MSRNREVGGGPPPNAATRVHAMNTRLLRALAGSAALALTLTMSACGSDDESPDTASSGGDQLELIKEGPLTVCSEIPYKPFEYEENGEFTGFDIDLSREIAERLDLELE